MIRIDFSEIQDLIDGDEIEEMFQEELEETITEIFIELTSPPPEGTPVDHGEARNSWQLDVDDPDAMEIWTASPYMGRLNDGSSHQSPKGFVDAGIDKHTRD